MLLPWRFEAMHYALCVPFFTQTFHTKKNKDGVNGGRAQTVPGRASREIVERTSLGGAQDGPRPAHDLFECQPWYSVCPSAINETVYTKITES